MRFSASRVRAAAAAAVILASAPAAPAQRGVPAPSQVQAASIVPEYAVVLRALDPANTESVVKARDAAIATYANADSAVADAVFRQFQAFYDRVLAAVPYLPVGSPLNALLHEICRADVLGCRATTADAFLTSSKPEDQRRRSEHFVAVTELAPYRANGIWFSQGEGDWYATYDPAFVKDYSAGLPLGELREWVAFRAAEDGQRVTYDAGLIVGWDDLRQRIGRWEAFARAHPALPETLERVRPQLANLVAIYVFGIDNTRAYDKRPGAPSGTLRVDSRLMASYERFLVENRDSAYHKVIDGIVTRVRASDGAPTRGLVDFLRAELKDAYFQSWLRVAERWLGGTTA